MCLVSAFSSVSYFVLAPLHQANPITKHGDIDYEAIVKLGDEWTNIRNIFSLFFFLLDSFV